MARISSSRMGKICQVIPQDITSAGMVSRPPALARVQDTVQASAGVICLNPEPAASWLARILLGKEVGGLASWARAGSSQRQPWLQWPWPADRQLNPVLAWEVLGLAHPPDVPAFHAVGEIVVASIVGHDHGCPLAAISKVLSWLPYSSAFCAISPTLDMSSGGPVELSHWPGSPG